jgi:nucleotide-binding universal stress UspA family protein
MTTPTTLHEVTELHPDGGVLVGDDGSSCAGAAVRAAAEEAVLREVKLHVVRAWSITSAVRPKDVPHGIIPSMREFEAATLDAERTRVAELLAGSPADASAGVKVEVEVHVVHAAPAKVLVEAAESADLLVVGTRGRGGFKRLLLGSVAEQCLRYAPCSVMVVREQ